MLDRVRAARGVVRSLRIYYGGRHRRAALDAIYSRFVARGDLVFDIGAHVGDRVAAFRRLGARVVVAEPQPALATTLRLLFGRDRAVTVEEVAVGRAAGTVALRINLDNPTVSTASDAFIAAADGAPGWEGQHWTRTIEVPVTTLDALIARHGRPRFIKIDVEGFEAEALAGSVVAGAGAVVRVHHHPARRRAGLHRRAPRSWATAASAPRSAKASPSSEERPWTPSEVAAWLVALPVEANSGDIYATLD